jgi:hypothetical protein
VRGAQGVPPTGIPGPCNTVRAGSGVRLGLAANAAQFTLLVAVNALVGGLLGAERTVLPLLAEHEFHVSLRLIRSRGRGW